MNEYIVRVHQLTWAGFLTQADHYEDFRLTSHEPLDVFAKRLALEGFPETGGSKWIMPGAIMRVYLA
jgi:hypothetical protein